MICLTPCGKCGCDVAHSEHDSNKGYPCWQSWGNQITMYYLHPDVGPTCGSTAPPPLFNKEGGFIQKSPQGARARLQPRAAVSPFGAKIQWPNGHRRQPLPVYPSLRPYLTRFCPGLPSLQRSDHLPGCGCSQRRKCYNHL